MNSSLFSKESFLERVKSAKKANEVGQVIFFNNGSVQTETNGFAKKMEDINDRVQIELLMDNLCDATACYAGRGYDMDTMEVGLLLGLIYNASDVDENNRPLEGAQPVNNVVRYYDVGFNSYKDGQKTNEGDDYGKYHVTYQGYVHYDKLVKAFEGSGIEFTGPRTFKAFKEAVQAGEVFDASLVADLLKYSKDNSSKLGK